MRVLLSTPPHPFKPLKDRISRREASLNHSQASRRGGAEKKRRVGGVAPALSASGDGLYPIRAGFL